MANQVPLTISSGQVQRLQAADQLVDIGGVIYVGVASNFGSSNRVVLTNDAGHEVVDHPPGTTFDALGDPLLVGANAGIGSTITGNNTVAIGEGVLRNSTITGDGNIVVGEDAGYLLYAADDNICIGTNSGQNANLTGRSFNAAIGTSTLAGSTVSGDNNFAFGQFSGGSSTIGAGNLMMGPFSGNGFVGSNYNVFLGPSAGRDAYSSAQSYNVAIGRNALRQSTITGSNNFGVGTSCGYSGSLGGINILFGPSAGQIGTLGNQNFCFGIGSGFAVNCGNNNAFIGPYSGFLCTATGQDNNTALGSSAFRQSTITGNGNVAVGTNSLRLSTITGDGNVAIGEDAGNSLYVAGDSIFIGTSSGQNTDSTGRSSNTAIGANTLTSSTVSGNNNLVCGSFAGYSSTVGGGNLMMGGYAGRGFSSSSYNVFLGFSAGRDANFYANNSNIAVGTNALRQSTITGSDNVGIGTICGYYSSMGSGNFLFGQSAGRSATLGNQNFCFSTNAGRDADCGNSNMFLGLYSGNSCTATGRSNNTGLGVNALRSSTITGNSNVAVGTNAANGASFGANNLFLGTHSGRSLNSTLCNTNIFIGSQAGYSGSQKTDAADTIVIGTSAVSTKDDQAVIGGTNITETILRGDVEIQNGTTPQELQVYETFTSDSNFERFRISFSGGTCTLETDDDGVTGTASALALGTNGTARLTLGATGDITVADGENIILNATTGTQIATATTQKLAFWGATPIVQPADANQAALSLTADLTGTDTIDQTSVESNFAAIETLVNQLRADLVAAGLIKGSA